MGIFDPIVNNTKSMKSIVPDKGDEIHVVNKGDKIVAKLKHGNQKYSKVEYNNGSVVETTSIKK